MTLVNQKTVDVDRSTGFHMFTFHWATTGMSVFAIAVLLGFIALIYVCIKWCLSRFNAAQRMCDPYRWFSAAAPAPHHQGYLMPPMQQPLPLPQPLPQPTPAAQPPFLASAPRKQDFDSDNDRWRDVHA